MQFAIVIASMLIAPAAMAAENNATDTATCMKQNGRVVLDKDGDEICRHDLDQWRKAGDDCLASGGNFIDAGDRNDDWTCVKPPGKPKRDLTSASAPAGDLPENVKKLLTEAWVCGIQEGSIIAKSAHVDHGELDEGCRVLRAFIEPGLPPAEP